MKTLNELQEERDKLSKKVDELYVKIEAFGFDINQLNEQIEQAKKPKKGRILHASQISLCDYYYRVFSDGNIGEFTFGNNTIDLLTIRQGNAYFDHESAEQRVRYNELVTAAKYAAQLACEAENKVIDWEDIRQKKWSAYYDHNKNKIRLIWDYSIQYSVVYFPSEGYIAAHYATLSEDDQKLLATGGV